MNQPDAGRAAVAAHQEWMGYVRPVGLVVSIPALLEAGAQLHQNAQELAALQADLRGVVDDADDRPARVTGFRALATTVLGWRDEDLANPPDDLAVAVPEYGDTLRPDAVVPDPAGGTMMLVRTLPAGTDLDAPDRDSPWKASPQAKFERLLREGGVPIGLIFNADALRLVYAPPGGSSGHVTFRVADMLGVAGRPILAALHMLLESHRLFGGDPKNRLPAVLADSRRFQNDVSVKLAGQVLAALYELLRGFGAADATAKGELLGPTLADRPNHVYDGLLVVLMRLVFLLFAEDQDRGLMPTDALYSDHYAVGTLFEQLRDDHDADPDNDDQRFGAWDRLLALFRIVHGGAHHESFHVPARRGYLFDPDRYPFLEGRRDPRDDATSLPRVPDGCVYRVLRNLLVLDGERLSYRRLDVEQIGSVYETMMGFELHVAAGPSLALRPAKRHGAPYHVDLAALLAAAPAKRAAWVKDRADLKLPAKVAAAVRDAATPDALADALDKRVDRRATPDVVPGGTMILQPSDERRRSGSHYTPRSLTEPVVREALRPVLAALGDRPSPGQILDLKICDPAMGSGAFLVEACRQLAAALVKAWAEHGGTRPPLRDDDDELLAAGRLVAQRCLYGVDRNPTAVDLAKLSLWLATLARDQPFTFLDHALRCGDSLVGLSRAQIEEFSWDRTGIRSDVRRRLMDRMNDVLAHRRAILDAGDFMSPDLKREKLDAAESSLALIRLSGDATLAAFFADKTKKARNSKRLVAMKDLMDWLKDADADARDRLGRGVRSFRAAGVNPFHWEIEFPEIFHRPDGGGAGFDAFVGNPPFAGKNTLIAGNHPKYLDYLKQTHPESHGNADLVAHFFRRTFDLLRPGGTLGLIATNTVGQGDTRSTGLRWLCTHGGTIYRATKRLKWPGEAAVVVSVVHLAKATDVPGPRVLDGREVGRITAYLFHEGGDETPHKLKANKGQSFQGSILLGMGFTFDDRAKSSSASPLWQMYNIIEAEPENQQVIFPYIGGEEVNNDPQHQHHRFAIDFGEIDDEDYARFKWPRLIKLLEERVKPERDAAYARNKNNINGKRAEDWWRHGAAATELYRAIQSVREPLVVNCGATPHVAFTRLPCRMVFANTLAVFQLESAQAFCVLQSRGHEFWARFFASSMKDDIRYTPTDCFETFPFPAGYAADAALEAAGRAYYDFRAELMVRNDQGLTKTYNRFHDPAERDADLLELRRLHATMDAAVLGAYGWGDLDARCGFGLDYLDVDERDLPGDVPEPLWFATAGEALAFAGRLPGKKSGRAKRLPWRYRWHDDARDDVLARLLKLNAERAAAERIAGPRSARRGS